MISFISTVYAQSTVDIGARFNSPWGVSSDLGDFFSLLTNLLIIVAGIIFLFIVISAGYKIISSAGSGEKNELASGGNALTYAIVGLLIVFVAFVVVRVIELILGYSFFTGL